MIVLFQGFDVVFNGAGHLLWECRHEHPPDVRLQVAVYISIVYRRVVALLLAGAGLLQVEEADVDGIGDGYGGILHGCLRGKGPGEASGAGVV